MLPPAEQDLVRRDLALPGLAILLEEEAFLGVLRQAHPNVDVRAARLNYVRYRPRTNCLAAYSVDAAGQTVDVYAKAWSREDCGKLVRTEQRHSAPGACALQPVLLPESLLAIGLFPDDAKLPALRLFYEPEYRAHFLEKRCGLGDGMTACSLETLNYTPERRFVGCLRQPGAPAVVLKLYSEGGFAAAHDKAMLRFGGESFRAPHLLGKSQRRLALAFRWVEGTLLSGILGKRDLDIEGLRRVAAALSELHGQSASGLPERTIADLALTARTRALMLGYLLPDVAARAQRLGERLVQALGGVVTRRVPSHGDFNSKQVLLDGQRVVFLDFDEAAWAHPGLDVGNFLANLEADALRGRLFPSRADEARQEFVASYATARRGPPLERVELFTAVRLFIRSPRLFRHREGHWPDLIQRTLERVDELLSGGFHRGAAIPAMAEPASDPEMPFLPRALDLAYMRPRLAMALNHLNGELAGKTLEEIRLLRHKPGRRCLIEYTFVPASPSAQEPGESVHFLGKVRARRLDQVTPRLLRELRAHGFAGEGVAAVPEPLGTVPELRLWLKRAVRGEPATQALLRNDGASVAVTIAEAVHALHGSGVCSPRVHTIANELDLLRNRLGRVRDSHGWLAERIERVWAACERLGGVLENHAPRLLHRDFYPDQVLVDDGRVWLLDLDLAAMGDPCLDHGNFLAHLEELNLRLFGRADALQECGAAYFERAVELAGPGTGPRIRHYTTLSLARHIFISTQFIERRDCTEALLDLCEERLGLPSHSPVN
jgi:aminoglycoside phosphotransferase (APT) family kinase protein